MPTINHKEPKRPWKPERKAHARRWNKDERYNSHRWRTLRAAFLKLNPLCIECEATDQGPTAATVVDHKRQVSQGADFWDGSNWQPLCAKHHNSKSGKESHTSHT